MKRTFITLSLLLVMAGSFAQSDKNPYPRTITVTGSAEMEIVPDEIYVQVELKEYDKKGQGKVSLDKIRQDFLKKLKALQIPDSLISIASYDGINGNPWWKKKNKKEELYASVSYQIKLKGSSQLDALVEQLDDNATQNFFIQKTSSGQLEALRKQLKIDAVKAAKEKATYLAAAVDERIGVAITINEPMEYYMPFAPTLRMANKALMAEAAVADTDAELDFKKIKLKYDVTVTFALQ